MSLGTPTADLSRTAADDALGRIADDGRSGIWIEVLERDEVMEAAAAVDRRRADGEALPLAGRTLAVKGNIDVGGHRTTAGCPSYGDVAARSAPAVAALERAGAVVVGITSLDQFATGLVGTRSPYGICPNAHWAPLVSGGSSSGSAVAVAAGLVDLAFGTDTAGSGRVPAAANGIVGVKPTRGRCSTLGVVPACRSLDCLSMFATSVELAHESLALVAVQPTEPNDPWRRRGELDGVPDRPLRIGIPVAADLRFDGDPDGRARFEAAVEVLAGSLAASGAAPMLYGFDLLPFLEAGALLYDGAFVAERYEAVGSFLERDRQDLDPIVREVVLGGASVAGWEVFRDMGELARLRQRTVATWSEVDLLVVPSVPRVPTVAEVQAEPIAVNRMLGTYTDFVNLLDLAAVTIPVGPPAPGGPPTSLTLIGRAWSDDVLASVASRVSRVATGSGSGGVPSDVR